MVIDQEKIVIDQKKSGISPMAIATKHDPPHSLAGQLPEASAGLNPGLKQLANNDGDI